MAIIERSLTIFNDMTTLPQVRELVSHGVRDSGFPVTFVNRMQIAVDEAVTNIIEHGYEERPKGTASVWLNLRASPKEFRIEILDEGEHFDPKALGDLDIHAHVEAGHLGGLGVFLMRRIMDVVDYHCEKGQRNRLVLTKHSS